MLLWDVTTSRKKTSRCRWGVPGREENEKNSTLDYGRPDVECKAEWVYRESLCARRRGLPLSGGNTRTMPVFESQVDTRSQEFAANYAHHEGLARLLAERLAKVREGGGPRAQRRQQEQGKKTARERIDLLLDPQSPFLEIAPLAAWEMYAGEAPAAGIVTGIGRVRGVECIIVANDATVKAGTYYPLTVKKHLRAQQVALENHLPCLYLVDSGGALLPRSEERRVGEEGWTRVSA